LKFIHKMLDALQAAIVHFRFCKTTQKTTPH
jgi:hypothetical protein